MWKLAQRSLLQGKFYRPIPRRCNLDRTCSLATTTTTTAAANTTTARGTNKETHRHHRHRNTISPGPRNQQQQHINPSSSSNKDAERLFESTKGFLEKISTSDSPWTRENLELANKILHTWSRQTVPRELQSSWMPMADKLMGTALDQYKIVISNNNNTNNNQQLSTALIPDSEVFCSMITMYSKTNLPRAAERADYWLQEMIKASSLYPDRVTAPRATLFANVLAAWEKSKLPDAELHAKRLWNQLKSTKGLTPTSSAYYLYISLWSKSNLPEAPEMAEKILREMIQKGKRNPKLLPTCPVFVNVISSWRRREGSDVPERAQVVIDLLVMEYTRRSKLPQHWMRFSINDVPFNATIQTWAASSSRETTTTPQLVEERIEIILKTMKELEVSPTMVTAWSALPMYSRDSDDEPSAAIQDVPAKVLRLLDLSMTQNGGGKNPLVQNQIFTKALEICSTCSSSPENSRTAAEVAEEILLNRYFKRP